MTKVRNIGVAQLKAARQLREERLALRRKLGQFCNTTEDVIHRAQLRVCECAENDEDRRLLLAMCGLAPEDVYPRKEAA